MPASTLTTPAPQNIEAERALLGALLMDADTLIDVRPILKASAFHDPVHRAIYDAIISLYDDRKPVDFVTVADTLRGNDSVAKSGGSAFLASLVADVPTASHAMGYAEIVRAKSLRRQLATLGQKL